MAPRKRLAVLVIVAAVLLLLSGSLAVAARGVPNGAYLGDDYIGCLEMGFSRCVAHPTLICLEDAMVECSLQQATTATELALRRGAIGRGIMRGITDLGAKYFECVELDLAKSWPSACSTLPWRASRGPWGRARRAFTYVRMSSSSTAGLLSSRSVYVA